MTKLIAWLALIAGGIYTTLTLGVIGGLPYAASLLLLYYTGYLEKYNKRFLKKVDREFQALSFAMSTFRESTEVLLRDNNLSWESREHINQVLKDTKKLDSTVRHDLAKSWNFKKIVTVKAEEASDKVNDILLSALTKKETTDAVHGMQQDNEQARPDKEQTHES